jgi:hypothetical protein
MRAKRLITSNFSCEEGREAEGVVGIWPWCYIVEQNLGKRAVKGTVPEARFLYCAQHPGTSLRSVSRCSQRGSSHRIGIQPAVGKPYRTLCGEQVSLCQFSALGYFPRITAKRLRRASCPPPKYFPSATPSNASALLRSARQRILIRSQNLLLSSLCLDCEASSRQEASGTQPPSSLVYKERCNSRPHPHHKLSSAPAATMSLRTSVRGTSLALRRIARPAVSTRLLAPCLATRASSSMAADGQQQLLSAHLEQADPAVFNIIEQVCGAFQTECKTYDVL